jgi:hypothetical protein
MSARISDSLTRISVEPAAHPLAVELALPTMSLIIVRRLRLLLQATEAALTSNPIARVTCNM